MPDQPFALASLASHLSHHQLMMSAELHFALVTAMQLLLLLLVHQFAQLVRAQWRIKLSIQVP
jgi:hypothetical protein